MTFEDLQDNVVAVQDGLLQNFLLNVKQDINIVITILKLFSKNNLKYYLKVSLDPKVMKITELM
jgi:hypothetical protein